MNRKIMWAVFIVLCLVFFPFSCYAEENVTVTFSFEDDCAYIGQPFSISYEITGGSGEYTDICFSAFGTTEMCCIDYYQLELTESSGKCTYTPSCGEFIDFSIVGTDSVTDMHWEIYSPRISCLPNPDIATSFIGIPSETSLSSELEIEYSIDCLNAIDTAKMSVWVFVDNDLYPNCLYEEELYSNTGKVLYTPLVGDALYVAIQGTDSLGNPFYLRSDRINLNGKSIYDPVSVTISLTEEKAYIGSPYTISYEINGGSGEYTDIYFTASGITEMCCIDYYQLELSETRGECTFIPSSGELVDFSIVCTDAVTNMHWEKYSPQIPCLSNPEITVTFNNLPSGIMLHDKLEVNYSIEDFFEIDTATMSIWIFTEDDIYPDNVFEQNLSSLSGTVAYTPRYGCEFYVAIQGKDCAGNPFYYKTDRIPIYNDLLLKDCIYLPKSIVQIESNAFSAVRSTKVVIPNTVKYIAEDAFSGSCITTIFGNSEYVEFYANRHGILFVRNTQ